MSGMAMLPESAADFWSAARSKFSARHCVAMAREADSGIIPAVAWARARAVSKSNMLWTDSESEKMRSRAS